MKLSLIVAVVVLALAQGSFAQDVPSLERLGQFFEEMKNKMTQELTELLSNPDLASHAQNVQTQLEPLTTQIQDQLRTVGEHIKPVADGMQAHIPPMIEKFQKQMESLFQMLSEPNKAVTN